MTTLAFDIETIGEDYDTLDETTKHVLTRHLRQMGLSDAEYELKLSELKDELGFSPYTGKIVAIGVYDVEKDKGVVYYDAPNEKNKDEQVGSVILKQMTEAKMLEAFWDGALHYNTFVSYNGRGFDVPYIIIRGAVHNIKPTKDLMFNRYVSSQKFDAKHIDLMDQLSFYGSVWKKPSLHVATRAFGIESPKAEGISGDDVGLLFKEKKFKDIARYNVRDIIATKELYVKWLNYIRA
jgi:3'-5' exonuclease